MRYRLFGTFRFALAVMVLLWHCSTISNINQGWPSQLEYGPVAVFVFFFLSGYIITEAIHFCYPRSPGRFLTNRLMRLYPPYLLALLACIAVFAVLPTPPVSWPAAAFAPRNLLANLAALFPFVFATDRLLQVGSRVDLLSIIWAVRIEFAFYFIAAAIVAFGTLCPQRWRREWLLWFACLGFLGLHLLFFYIVPAGRASFYSAYIPHFVLGSLYALWVARWLAHAYWLPLMIAAGILSGLQVLVYPLEYGGGGALMDKATIAANWAAVVLYMVLTACAFVLARAPAEGAAKRRDKRLGDYSYPIYLLHIPAIAVVGMLDPERSVMLVSAAVVITLALSWLLLRVSDAPLRVLRARVRGRELP